MPYSAPADDFEARRFEATTRLVAARKQHPELSRAEAAARGHLAAAIITLDKALESGPAIGEQVDLRAASNMYAQALANLVRGESSN